MTDNPNAHHSRAGWLFVVPWELDYGGGVNQVVTNLIREIDRSDRYRPILLVNRWDHPTFTRESASNPELWRFRVRGPWSAKAPLRNFARYLASLPSDLPTLSRALQHAHVRVVNVHYPGLWALQFVLLRALRLTRARFIVSVHGADVRNALIARGMDAKLWRLLISSADAVIPCSENLAADVRTLCPDASDRISVIHNGIDSERFLTGSARDFPVPSQIAGSPYILNVATFEHKKGQDLLIRAFAELAPSWPEVQLALVGGQGPEREKLSRLSAELGVADRVHFFENVPHSRIPVFMQSATVFALSSREEPFGIVLLEAAACEVPVVATAVGGIPEIVNDESLGRLVPPDDVDSLRRALEQVLVEPEIARAKARALHERVVKDFSWRSSAEQYLKVTS
jgi:glycosyltransferase involved in cell wall biosynthesis